MNEPRRYIDEEIIWIDRMAKTRKCKIQLKGTKTSATGYLKKQKGKGFVLDIASAGFRKHDVGDHVKLCIISGGLQFTSDDAYIKNAGVSVSNGKARQHYSFQIARMRASPVSESRKYYFRSITPLKTNLSFFNIFKDDSY